MATGTINIAAVTDALRKSAPLEFADSTVKRSAMFQRMNEGPPTDSRGARWKIKTGSNDSITGFAEGASFPDPGRTEREEAFEERGRYVGTLKLTGDTMDAEKFTSNWLIVNHLQEELKEIIDGIIDLADSDLRSGTNANRLTGITTAVNNTGTYATINRGTVTQFASFINPVGGVLTMAALNTNHLNHVDTRGGNYDVIYSAQNQLDRYVALNTGAGAVTQIHMVMDQNGENVFRAGFGGMDPMKPAAYYRNRPWFVIPGYGTQRIDFLNQATGDSRPTGLSP